MKTLLALASVLLAFTSAAPAVTWSLVTVSVVVKQSSTGGALLVTTLNNRKYLDKVAAQFSIPKDDLFIGFREDTGQISVVQRSTELVRYNIVSGLTAQGTASNGTSTKQSIAVSATVSSLNTDMNGFAVDSVERFPSGNIKSVKRTFVGGAGNQTLKGTATTTGRRIEL